jgi:hypothetical protein
MARKTQSLGVLFYFFVLFSFVARIRQGGQIVKILSGPSTVYEVIIFCR